MKLKNLFTIIFVIAFLAMSAGSAMAGSSAQEGPETPPPAPTYEEQPTPLAYPPAQPTVKPGIPTCTITKNIRFYWQPNNVNGGIIEGAKSYVIAEVLQTGTWAKIRIVRGQTEMVTYIMGKDCKLNP